MPIPNFTALRPDIKPDLRGHPPTSPFNATATSATNHPSTCSLIFERTSDRDGYGPTNGKLGVYLKTCLTCVTPLSPRTPQPATPCEMNAIRFHPRHERARL